MGRWAALMIWALAAYFAYIAGAVAFAILRSLFSGPWLGLEPELMIPLIGFLIAGGLIWLGHRVWSRPPTT